MSYRITTHASLLARVSEGGDRAAWDEFCARYGDLIRGFARRRGLQVADADEIMQDVLTALTKSMPGFVYDPSKGKFRSYLKTLAMRAVYRKTIQKRPSVPLEDVEGVVPAGGGDEETDRLWEEEWRQYHVTQAMRTIHVEFNEADCESFQQYAVEGRSAQEAADMLGRKAEQVYQAKSRILNRLSELIAEQVSEEG